jgi:plasmid stabilization system protein ParE
MKLVRFNPDAEAEMIQAAAWYESQHPDLGKRFIASVEDAINRIELKPELYLEVESGIRRCLTKTFPYGVLFRIKPDEIEVSAVMHLHREPGYWKDR